LELAKLAELAATIESSDEEPSRSPIEQEATTLVDETILVFDGCGRGIV
jgi:hypothetical protein